MNPFKAKSILFLAEFNEDGTLEVSNEKSFEQCLETAALVNAKIVILNVKKYSDRVSWNPEYDNSPKQQQARRIEYTLTGMMIQAESALVKAETRVLFGNVAEVVSKVKNDVGLDVVWSNDSVLDAPVPRQLLTMAS